MIAVPMPLIDAIKKLCELHRQGHTPAILEGLDQLISAIDNSAVNTTETTIEFDSKLLADLKEQLNAIYSTIIPQEREIAAQEAIRNIESNPPLKARVIGAIKAAGVEALKEAIDHPVINVVLAGWEGWQQAEYQSSKGEYNE